MKRDLRKARYHVMLLLIVLLGTGLVITPLFEPGSASQRNWVTNNVILLLTILLNLAFTWRSRRSAWTTVAWGIAWILYVLAISAVFFTDQDFDTLVTAGSFALVSVVAWYLYWAAEPARDERQPLA